MEEQFSKLQPFADTRPRCYPDSMIAPNPRERRMAEPSDSPLATLTLRGEHITLAQAVKAVGLADTGGQAKHLVRDGDFTVNGVAEKQPGRKLRAGDRFGVVGGGQWTIIA